MNQDIAVSEKKEDLLNRYPFAEEIVSGLLTSFNNTHESIVIGLTGSWGCGKSSLMNFIKTEITRRKEEAKQKYDFTPTIVEFNPWMFSGQEELLKSFLITLSVELKGWSPELENLSQDIKNFAKRLEKTSSFNPEPKTRLLAKIASWTLRNAGDKLSQDKGLIHLKRDVDSRLEQTKIHPFIFIDDVDRLSPYEVTQIFKLVKLNSNFKNTVFFVAFDEEQVTSSISGEYRIDGKKYIEKIIQANYNVPPASKKIIKSIFEKELNAYLVMKNIELDFSEMKDPFRRNFSEYFNSLRDVYRYLNAIKLRLPGIYKEINIKDFLTVEAIRIFEKGAYELITENKYDLIYKHDDLRPSTISNWTTAFEEKIKATQFSNLTQELINSLFNRSESNEKLYKERSINHSDYFDRYFALGITNEDVSEEDFQVFANNESTNIKNGVLEKYYSNQVLRKFCDKLLVDIEKIPMQKIIAMISVLLNFLDQKNLYQSLNRMWGVTDFDVVINTIAEVAKKLKVKLQNNETLFMEICGNTSVESYSRFYIAEHLCFRIKTEDTKSIFENMFDLDFLKTHQSTIQSFYDSQLDKIGLSSISRPQREEIAKIKFIAPLYFKKDSKTYTNIIESRLKIKDSLIKYFRASMETGSASNIGNFFVFRKNDFLPGLTIEKFEEGFDSIDQKTLTQEEKKYYNLFYKFKENGFKESKGFNLELKDIGFDF